MRTAVLGRQAAGGIQLRRGRLRWRRAEGLTLRGAWPSACGSRRSPGSSRWTATPEVALLADVGSSSHRGQLTALPDRSSRWRGRLLRPWGRRVLVALVDTLARADRGCASWNAPSPPTEIEGTTGADADARRGRRRVFAGADAFASVLISHGVHSLRSPFFRDATGGVRRLSRALANHSFAAKFAQKLKEGSESPPAPSSPPRRDGSMPRRPPRAR